MVMTPQLALAEAARRRGVALSALSRMLGRNQAYLGQFVNRGSPRVLPERERRMLADFLDLDEALLGAPPPPTQEVTVPLLAVTAAAGAGRVPEERVIGRAIVPRTALRAAGVAPDAASLIGVAGDSMAPTLRDGDRVLVDRNARRLVARGGIYVLRRAEMIAVKRLIPHGSAVEIRSDNPLWPVERVGADEIEVIGRARLLLRTL
ncbi:phage repressor protein C with HTH and peptisase S24 domain [Sphingomonas sp. BE138]|uniref:S24 family peptidase n=1 Tax=Sphingomonas sp. BE138 TaxID=2817845 RepID=UPI0028614AF8|nr:S24 family peptidase [Sphingomonas sp. BE138]MDR6788375.1 phage repressor protein C with HTH and peptisase S24 domain [Sphingomonas sp. BE138]